MQSLFPRPIRAANTSDESNCLEERNKEVRRKVGLAKEITKEMLIEEKAQVDEMLAYEFKDKNANSRKSNGENACKVKRCKNK